MCRLPISVDEDDIICALVSFSFLWRGRSWGTARDNDVIVIYAGWLGWLVWLQSNLGSTYMMISKLFFLLHARYVKRGTSVMTLSNVIQQILLNAFILSLKCKVIIINKSIISVEASTGPLFLLWIIVIVLVLFTVRPKRSGRLSPMTLSDWRSIGEKKKEGRLRLVKRLGLIPRFSHFVGSCVSS